MKRIVDLFVASLALVAASVPMAAIAAAIRLTSRGPAIFRQERVGLGGKTFEIYKFRSMFVDNDDSAHRQLAEAGLVDPDFDPGTTDGAYKLENDPRITSVGRWIRRLSLDELPQLLNVLEGTMSMVGPRPHSRWEDDLFPIEQRQARHRVKPGITGLWQVSGRNQVPTPVMLRLDCEYVESQNLVLDLRILAKTPGVLVRGDGAR